jgi:hypothetical protein
VHSLPSADLQAAYAQTRYRVLLRAEASRFLDFWVGQHSADLDELLLQRGLQSAGYITAWNPFSCQPLPSRAENRSANQRLQAALLQQGFKSLPAIGLDPQRLWPGEPGFLALGVSAAALCALGRSYQQHAVVHYVLGAQAELLCCARP